MFAMWIKTKSRSQLAKSIVDLRFSHLPLWHKNECRHLFTVRPTQFESGVVQYDEITMREHKNFQEDTHFVRAHTI